jgi:hypothetical protein
VILGDGCDQPEGTLNLPISTRGPSPPPVSRLSNFSADSGSKVTVLSASDYYADRDLPPTPSIYSPDRSVFASSFPQHRPLSRSRSESSRSASILNLDRKAVVKRRISQLEPHRKDLQSTRPKSRPGSDLRRRGSTHSTDSDSLLELYTVESAVSATEPYTRAIWPAPSLALIPEVASVSQISEHHGALSVSPSFNRPAPSADTEGRLAPLVELLQDQATKHYYHTNDLKDQIASLNSEMHTMFQELKVVIGEQPVQEVDMSKFEEALDKSFAALETTVESLHGRHGGTPELREKLDAIHEQVKSLEALGKTAPPSNPDVNPVGEAVLEKLETLRMEINDQKGLPENVVAEIAKLRELLDRLPPEEVTALRNVGKSQEPTPVPVVDLSEVHSKLDGVIESLKLQLAKEPAAPKVEIPEVRGVLCPSDWLLSHVPTVTRRYEDPG